MILSCGEALIDMVPLVLPNGSSAYAPCPGGSPYNTAVAVGRLGVPISFLGRLSNDFFGTMLVDRLEKNNVRTDFLVRSNQTTTLAFVKLEKGKEPQYIFYTEGSADRSLSPEDLPAKLPAEIRCILFGSISMTMEPVASTIESFIGREAGRGEDAPIISVDPNVRPMMIRDHGAYVKRFEGWIRKAAIAKISEADYDFIYPGLGLEKSLLKTLESGPRMAVTTLGKEGAMALLKKPGGGILRVSAPVIDVPVADTIGAGDTFHAGFLSWLELHGKMSQSGLASLSEGELYDALFFANKAASLVCSKQGAEPPTMAEMEALKQ
jgi:fructokinase